MTSTVFADLALAFALAQAAAEVDGCGSGDPVVSAMAHGQLPRPLPCAARVAVALALGLAWASSVSQMLASGRGLPVLVDDVCASRRCVDALQHTLRELRAGRACAASAAALSAPAAPATPAATSFLKLAASPRPPFTYLWSAGKLFALDGLGAMYNMTDNGGYSYARGYLTRSDEQGDDLQQLMLVGPSSYQIKLRQIGSTATFYLAAVVTSGVGSVPTGTTVIFDPYNNAICTSAPSDAAMSQPQMVMNVGMFAVISASVSV